jgi:serine/threonine protein kinase
MLNQQLHNYKIISLLGEGGMATVYLAENTSLKIHVALKVLKEDYVRNNNIRNRFLAEARNLAKMQHPSVIKVADLIDAGDIVAFAMEYIQGETIDDFVIKNGTLTEKSIKNVFNQILDAVDYVHNMGIIHRDIKPSNFMVTDSEIVKLLDFGIAKNKAENHTDYTKTGLSDQLGTPAYMSPEQIRSTSAVNEQSDVYSLGVLLWFLLKGKSPYSGFDSSIFDLQNKIVFEKLPLTNTKFDGIIQKATEKHLVNRYDSVRELKSAFNRMLKEPKVIDMSLTQESSEGATTAIQKKSKLPYIIGGGTALLGGALAVIMMLMKDEVPAESQKMLTKDDLKNYVCQNMNDITKDRRVDFAADTITNSQCEGTNYIFIIEDSTIVEIKTEIINKPKNSDDAEPEEEINVPAPKKIKNMSKQEITSLEVGASVADEKGDFEVHGFKISVENKKVKSKDKVKVENSSVNILKNHTVKAIQGLEAIVQLYITKCPKLNKEALINHNLDNNSRLKSSDKQTLNQGKTIEGMVLEIPCD